VGGVLTLCSNIPRSAPCATLVTYDFICDFFEDFETHFRLINGYKNSIPIYSVIINLGD
jgi:hypothetical protein